MTALNREAAGLGEHGAANENGPAEPTPPPEPEPEPAQPVPEQQT